MKKLTKEQKRQAAVIAVKTDADIDLSDAPEVMDWAGAATGNTISEASSDNARIADLLM